CLWEITGVAGGPFQGSTFAALWLSSQQTHAGSNACPDGPTIQTCPIYRFLSRHSGNYKEQLRTKRLINSLAQQFRDALRYGVSFGGKGIGSCFYLLPIRIC